MLLILAAPVAASAATINDLYNFAGGVNDGAYPYGSLTAVGSILYGMTSEGGGDQGPPNDQVGDGTIFAFNTATNTETVLHPFAGEPTDGAFPEYGSLVQSSTNPDLFYGLTQGGGTGGGALISYNIATGAESMLLNSFSVDEFSGGPLGSVVQVGNTLYGLAGGLFSFNLTTSTLAPLYSFGTPGLQGTPVLIGSTLYGVSRESGDPAGVIWSYNVNTGVETPVYAFPSGYGGAYNFLTASDDTLYGTTDNGIFSYNTSTGAFETLISRNNIYTGPSALILDGSTLYGASVGGEDIYSFNLDSNTFTVVGSFGDPVNGNEPIGGLTLVGSTLYGMTESGGAGAEEGVIYSIEIPEPVTFSMFVAAGGCLLLRRWRK
jgi:uncharacterized repeat protein (TIGR03803 family)